MDNVKKLREENEELSSKMNELLAQAQDANASTDQIRSANDEMDQVEEALAKNAAKLATADKAERLSSLQYGKRSNEVDPNRPGRFGVSPKDHDLAFRAQLLESAGYQAPKEWSNIAAKLNYGGDISLRSVDAYSFRSGQTVGTTTEGGYLAHTELATWIEKATKAYGGVKEVCRTLQTSTATDLYLPTFDNTSGISGVHTENAAITSADKAFGRITIKAATNATATYPVSIELIRDASFNVYELIGSALGEDIARFQNNKLTVGTGTSGDAAFNGMVVASLVGKTAALTTAVTWLEILDLIASLDYSYISSPNFGLMMHYLTYSKLLQIVDSQGRPLFLSSITEGGKRTLCGYPIYINNDMTSTFAASAKVVLAGDFSKYICREVQGVNVMTLKERFADQLSVGFVAYSCFGGNCVNTSAIKHLKLAAS